MDDRELNEILAEIKQRSSAAGNTADQKTDDRIVLPKLDTQPKRFEETAEDIVGDILRSIDNAPIEPEAPVIAEATQEPEVPQTPEIPEVPEIPQEPEMLETPEVPDIASADKDLFSVLEDKTEEKPAEHTQQENIPATELQAEEDEPQADEDIFAIIDDGEQNDAPLPAAKKETGIDLVSVAEEDSKKSGSKKPLIIALIFLIILAIGAGVQEIFSGG